MKKLLKSKFPRIFGLLKVTISMILSRESYIYSSGYYMSAVLGRPSDSEGNEVPWMNYSVIQFLDKVICNNMALFEYGSGSSTLFFAKRAKSVVSCEHDSVWFEKIKSSLPNNAKIIFKEEDVDGEYCRSIDDEDMLFDIVVIDGRDRVNCVKQSIERLTDSGVIVLDDSHRKEYQFLFSWMEKKCFRSITIEGLKPVMKKAHSTSIFYRDGNCFGL